MSLRILLILLTAIFLPFQLFQADEARAEEFLDPAVAFRPSLRALDSQTVEVGFDIAKGYYLYRERFKFEAAPNIPGQAAPALGDPVFPAGKLKDDEAFGKVEVYYNQVSIRLPVERNSSGTLNFTLKITSMGCAEGGICYPPQTQPLRVSLPSAGSAEEEALKAQATSTTPKSNTTTDDAYGNNSSVGNGDEAGRIAALLKNASLWLILFSFFTSGLLLSLTPCVFPMIPILSGIIVKSSGKDGKSISRGRAFSLSLSYVLGMALTYALAGVAAALAGTLMTSFLQNAWVLGAFALIFVVLALSMFGFFDLQMPSFLQSKVSERSSQIKGGSLPAVVVMGALSALIAGPCVAAPLAGALLYIGQTQNAVLGGTALFIMGMGMGVPLLIVGASAGTLLPRSGPWMEAVKKSFGVILLATALWFVAPLLPPSLVLGAWALLLIVPAVFLHALDSLPRHARPVQRFWKAVGVIMLLVGIAYLIGALAGAHDPLKPLGFLSSANPSGKISPATSSLFTRVKTGAELDARLNEAKTASRPVILDFYADWCVSCKEMERDTFADPAVYQRLQDFVRLQADVTENSTEDIALLKRFNLFGPPGIIFWDQAGNEHKNVRVVGYQKPAEFLDNLQQVLANEKKKL